jgi:hypothetical protein
VSVHHAARAAGRVVAAGAAALTAVLSLAGPASAHAEVEADTPRALANNVTLAFTSEAESATAGFTQVRVVLPEGIAPDDVTLGDAPKGWKLKTADDGYTVAGPALKTGVDAEYKVKVLLALLAQWAATDRRTAARTDRQAYRDHDAELAAYNAYLARLAARDNRT